MLDGLPWCHSASQMFSNINVHAYQAVIRNLIFKFMCRLDKSENYIIQGLVIMLNMVSELNILQNLLPWNWLIE